MESNFGIEPNNQMNIVFSEYEESPKQPGLSYQEYMQQYRRFQLWKEWVKLVRAHAFRADERPDMPNHYAKILNADFPDLMPAEVVSAAGGRYQLKVNQPYLQDFSDILEDPTHIPNIVTDSLEDIEAIAVIPAPNQDEKAAA